MARLPVFLVAAAAALVLAAVPSGAGADTLRFSSDLLYALAAFTEGEQAALLDGLRRENPDLILSNLTREDSAVRIHLGSRGFIEFLSNELYSLAVYIPAGVESDISRRSSPQLRVGQITRDAEGVTLYLGTSSGARQQDAGRVPAAGVPDNPPRGISAPSPSGAAQPGTGQKEPAVKVVVLPLSAPAVSVKAEAAPPAAGPLPREKPAGVENSPQPEPGAPVPAVKPLPVPVPGKKASPSVPDGRTLVVGNLDGPPPVVDGKVDEVWTSAARATIKIGPGANQVEAAGLSTSERIYLLFSWSDPDPAVDHRPWFWKEGEGRYERSGLMDDGIAVWWGEAGKPLFPNTGTETWDLWMWRAGREGLGQYASDASFSVSRRPLHMASYEDQKYRVATWSRMEFDRGRLPFEIVIPLQFSGPKITSYAAERPDSSASDVQAAGTWSKGKWVVELSRPLITGRDDDLSFERGENRSFVVSLLGDEKLAASPASGVLTIRWGDSM